MPSAAPHPPAAVAPTRIPKPAEASAAKRARESAKPVVVVAVLLGAFFLLQSWIPLRTAVQIGADEGFEVAKATLCLHGHRLYSEVWNDQPPFHTWLITQILKLQSRNWSSRLVTPTFESARSPVGKPALPGTGSTSAAAEPGQADRRDALSHDNPDRRDALSHDNPDRQDALSHYSILGPRLLTSAFTALLLAGVFVIVWRISGLLVGTLTTALLLVSPGFLELSSSCMLEIPSLATALAGLAVLVVVRPGRWHAAEILCGILFGLAALMKLVPLYLLPLAALIVWLRQRDNQLATMPSRPPSPSPRPSPHPMGRGWSLDRLRGSCAPSIALKSLRRLFVALLVLGVSLAAAFVFVDWLIEHGAYLAHFGQSWSSHFGGVKSFEFGSPADHAFDWSILLKNWDLTVPAVLGMFVLFTRLRKGPTAMLPPVWLALALLVFTNHKPWWAYYYIHLAVPLCWCAAVGLVFAWSAIVRGRQRGMGKGINGKGKKHRFSTFHSSAVHSPAFSSELAFGCAALGSLAALLFALGAAGWMGTRVWLQIADIRSSPQLHAALVLKEIARLKPFTRWMYTDQIVHSFHANIPLPPPLAVVPLKRLWAGDMTPARLATELARFKPEIILLGNDTREVPFQELLMTEYRLIYEDARQRLYAARATLQLADAAEAQRNLVRAPSP